MSTHYPVRRLVEFFESKKVGTIMELKESLGSHSAVTIFRKLRALKYLSSCSHSGKYYTLRRMAEFDELGLWRWKSVLFSSYGTFDETLCELINKAHKGYSAAELSVLMGMHPNAVLLELVSQRKASRSKVKGVYIYYSIDMAVATKQERIREYSIQGVGSTVMRSEVMTDELKAAIVLFFSSLDQQQQRLYAGMESLKIGDGGNRKIAELLGIDIRTVSEGRRQLLEEDVNTESVRKKGGGRKKIEKKSS